MDDDDGLSLPGLNELNEDPNAPVTLEDIKKQLGILAKATEQYEKLVQHAVISRSFDDVNMYFVKSAEITSKQKQLENKLKELERQKMIAKYGENYNQSPDTPPEQPVRDWALTAEQPVPVAEQNQSAEAPPAEVVHENVEANPAPEAAAPEVPAVDPNQTDQNNQTQTDNTQPSQENQANQEAPQNPAPEPAPVEPNQAYQQNQNPPAQ